MFGQYLKALRLEKGLTQKELCTKLNLAESGLASIDSVTLSRWERGVTEPHATKAIKVLRILTDDLRPYLRTISVEEKEDIISRLAYEKFQSINAGAAAASYTLPENNQAVDRVIKKEINPDLDKHVFENMKNFLHTSKAGYPGLTNLDFEALYRNKKLILSLYVNPDSQAIVGHNLAVLFRAKDLTNALITPHDSLPFKKITTYGEKKPLAICSLSRFATTLNTFNTIHSDFVDYIANHSNIHFYYHYLNSHFLFDYFETIGAEKVGYDTLDPHGVVKIGTKAYRNCLFKIESEVILTRPEILRLLQRKQK